MIERRLTKLGSPCASRLSLCPTRDRSCSRKLAHKCEDTVREFNGPASRSPPVQDPAFPLSIRNKALTILAPITDGHLDILAYDSAIPPNLPITSSALVQSVEPAQEWFTRLHVAVDCTAVVRAPLRPPLRGHSRKCASQMLGETRR